MRVCVLIRFNDEMMNFISILLLVCLKMNIIYQWEDIVSKSNRFIINTMGPDGNINTETELIDKWRLTAILKLKEHN